MASVHIFKLDNLNIILNIRSGNIETTTTHSIAWSTIRSISVDHNRINIYHAHQQSIFNIDGELISMEDTA